MSMIGSGCAGPMCLPLECWQPLVEKLLVRALNAILSFMPYLLSTLVYLIPLIELYS